MREKDELEDIIINKRIRSVFQPIVSLRDGNIIGYEALSRITGDTEIANIDRLFDIAAENELLWDLEQLCRKTALQKASKDQKFTGNEYLFLNVSPWIIYDPKFREGFTNTYLQRYHMDASQIVFEITERESKTDMKGFGEIIEHYKNQHYQIAIDDLGSCYSGLNLICELQPHFVKLDMQLVRGIHVHSNKFSLVKGLMEFARMANVMLIAEGIETKEELEALIDIGIQYGQGYFLARPQEKMGDITSEAKDNIRKLNEKKWNMVNHNMNKYYVKNILTNGLTVSENEKVEKLASIFELNEKVPGLCVIRNRKVVGILTKEKFQKIISGRYGFSLHQNKEVKSIMDRDFLEVDEQVSMRVASEMAMERDENSLYDFLVVTKMGNYSGIVTIKDLLVQSTEMSVNTAKALNPLSGLPGNLLINEEMNRILEEKRQYTAIYIDMDNFKAFNDVYGFERGDEMIRTMAQILVEKVGEENFIGHIGGDDFVVILYHHDYEELVRELEKEFEVRAQRFYSDKDREKKYIETQNRHGDIERFPLISATIVAVTDKEKFFFSQYELSEELAERKKIAKQKRCNRNVSK